MENSEKGSAGGLDPEINQNLLGLQACDFPSTLIPLPWLTAVLHT